MKSGGDEQVAKDIWASILELIEAVSQPICGSVNPPVPEDMFEDEDEVDWVREDRIKPLIWSKKWSPFTEYEGSSHLILDLGPGVNGSIGQVAFDDLYFV